MELSPVLAELERLSKPLMVMYNLQEALENPPVVTLASKGRKRTTVGWYVPAVWKDTQEDMLAVLAGLDTQTVEQEVVKRAEVVIATELVDDPVSTVSELLRLLIVHNEAQRYKANDNPLEGTLGQNAYYPEWWSKYAHRYNHTASVLDSQPSRGWADWRPAPDFVEWVNAEVNKGVFEVARVNQGAAEKKGSRMKKWRCNCTTVRCATKLDGHCDSCGAYYAWAESTPAPEGYRTSPLDVDVPPVDYEANRLDNAARAAAWGSATTRVGGSF